MSNHWTLRSDGNITGRLQKNASLTERIMLMNISLYNTKNQRKVCMTYRLWKSTRGPKWHRTDAERNYMSKTDKKKKIYMTEKLSDKCRLRCKTANKEHHKANTSIRKDTIHSSEKVNSRCFKTTNSVWDKSRHYNTSVS